MPNPTNAKHDAVVTPAPAWPARSCHHNASGSGRFSEAKASAVPTPRPRVWPAPWSGVARLGSRGRAGCSLGWRAAPRLPHRDSTLTGLVRGRSVRVEQAGPQPGGLRAATETACQAQGPALRADAWRDVSAPARAEGRQCPRPRAMTSAPALAREATERPAHAFDPIGQPPRAIAIKNAAEARTVDFVDNRPAKIVFTLISRPPVITPSKATMESFYPSPRGPPRTGPMVRLS